MSGVRCFLINTIDFTNCYIENFRSIVRSKKATGNVGAIAFKECTINAIGNQGIVSTDGKNGNYINDVSLMSVLSLIFAVLQICGIVAVERVFRLQTLHSVMRRWKTPSYSG